jgi:hypothetical protein
MTQDEKPKGGDGCFLVAWAYLMLLSICLSPVIAQVIKQGLD